MKYYFLLIGFFLDLFDWLLVGLVPILGDFVDLAATVLWYRKLGTLGLVDLVEVVPGADILPTNMILGYLADRKGGKQA